MRRALVLACLCAGALPVGSASAADFVEGTAGISQPLVTFPAPAPTQASIDWGDGTAAEPATVQKAPDDSGSVSGAHAYAKHGSFTVSVTGGAPPVTRTVTANVADAPITAQGVNGATAATAGGVTLATISDGNALGVPASLEAKIDWGDGTTTDGAVVSAGQPGRYLVQGSHAYPDGGSYFAVVTIRSADGGTAEATAEAQFEGVPDTSPTTTQGRVLDLGQSSIGAVPSITVDDAGTAYLSWTVTTAGGSGEAIAFCRVPRGARTCDLRKTLNYKPFAYRTTILRGASGRLYIVAAHILTGRGGTIVLTSGDNGQTWAPQRFDVNVGIFQSAVSSAALSRDEKAIYITYGPFFNLSGAPLQGIAKLDLTTGTPWIGDESFQRRVLVGAGVLPDGRGVGLANRHPDVKDGPLVALRVVGDANNATTDQPWTPVSGASARKLATSPTLASVLDCAPVRVDPFGTRIGAIPLRGLRAGTIRPLGFLTGDNSDCGDLDLTYDAAGGQHVAYAGTADGCPSSSSVEPGRDRGARVCLLYRVAPPNGDFRPKTILAEIDPQAKVGGTEVGAPQGVRVGAGRDGKGWVVWRSFNDRHIRMIPTRDDTQAPVTDTHPVSLKVLPNAECTNTNSARVTATVGGPAKNRPRILSVAWTGARGVLPRSETDRGAPFSITAKVDPAIYRGLSSTGLITVSSLVRGAVRVRTSNGRVKTVRVQVPLSYYCSIKWDDVERRYAPRRPR
ncbi:MAG: hypothetical protein JHC95_00590 [Solirubrobacteraceae bacterium]|nr:hypothetical protein [Solirubrobacteraceae bacterium]